jgi:virulence factor
MIATLIDKYKNYRKQGYLNFPGQYKHKYAFIGVGNHSISNLYPNIDYLGVPLKYIVTRSRSNAEKMALRYAHALGTNRIDDILNDDEVKAVFICSSPAVHFALTKECLEAGKSVFVEKPPCMNLKEFQILQALSEEKAVHWITGLQKRYASVYSVLKAQMKKVHTYNMRFLTGAYPEGDELLDLFIHPLDLIIFLFGNINTFQLSYTQNGGTLSLFLQTVHHTGIQGIMELSTAYSWDNAVETMLVNSDKGIFEVENMHKLSYYPKSPSLMGIPLEKVISFHNKKYLLFNNTGFVPVGKYNQVYTQGYFSEIKAFVNLVEGKRAGEKTRPDQVLPTYILLEDIRKSMQ